MSNTKEILKRRQFVATARHSPFWALINAGSLLLCLVDFIYSLISPLFYLKILQNLFLFVEFILIVIFFVNVTYNLYLYVWFKKFMQPIELSSNECALFGIDPKEVGFKLREDNNSTAGSGDKSLLNSFKSSPIPAFELSTSSILDKHPSLDSTRLFDTSQETISHSWSFTRPNVSPQRMSIRTSPNQSFNNSATPDLRLRKSTSLLSKVGSPRSSAVISSEDELKRYLAEQNERAEQMQELIQGQKHFSSMDEENHSGPRHHSFYGSPKRDHSHVIGSPLSPKNQFPTSPLARSSLSTSETNFTSPHFSGNFNSAHTSPHSPQSGHVDPRTLQHRSLDSGTPAYMTYQPAIKVSILPSSPNEKSETLNSSTRAVEKMLTKLDVDDTRLNQMVENIRKWISQTILVRLVAEIESINKAITEKGYIDSLIGETSVKQLKQLVINKKSEFPTLEQVCAFLDINVRNIENNVPFQQYLVRRIKDLAKGGCMIEFLWDGGGSYNYKHWKDDMVTDSEIILHVFGVYMDSRLLFNPTIPEGKPFTTQHFKSYNGVTPKSDTYIEQDKSYPPHYSLVLKGEPFELPKGRNNLFYALLVFLHHIKVKNFGLLGRINLGSSGLNISWVIDK